jgi:hypothetical protein
MAHLLEKAHPPPDQVVPNKGLTIDLYQREAPKNRVRGGASHMQCRLARWHIAFRTATICEQKLARPLVGSLRIIIDGLAAYARHYADTGRETSGIGS